MVAGLVAVGLSAVAGVQAGALVGALLLIGLVLGALVIAAL